MKESLPVVQEWLNNQTNPSHRHTLKNLRLPRNVHPVSYDLELFPDIYQASPKEFRFFGNVSIIMNCTETSSNITIHVNQLKIEKSTLYVTLYNRMLTTNNLFLNTTHDEDRQFLVLNLHTNLQAGEQYLLFMQYQGHLKDDLAGLYYSTYKRGNETM